jgi:hypothetical protein
VILILFAITFAKVPASETTSVLAKWEARESEIRSADVAWYVSRSSHNPDFGLGNSLAQRAKWRLRISGANIRQDGERLTVRMRDDRTRPAEEDPDRARRQFRHILLEEQLAGIQDTPFVESISGIRTVGRDSEGRRFGVLEQMMFDVLVWCARPQSSFPNWLPSNAGDSTGSTRKVIVLSIDARSGRKRTLHVEPTGLHRILRVMETEAGRPVSQADLSYSNADDPFPATWTVQRFNSTGQPLDFTEARRFEVSINVPPKEADFRTGVETSSDSGPTQSQSMLQRRRTIRQWFDSIWIWPTAFGMLIVITAVRRGLSRHCGRGLPVGAARAKSRTKWPAVAALLVVAVVLFQAVPLFDPPLLEVHQRLQAIQREAIRSKGMSRESKDRQSLQHQLLGDLTTISSELKRSNDRRNGLWAFVHKTAQQDNAAWRDALRLAESELPAQLNERESRNEARQNLIQSTLDRLDDHLAGAGPYMPPPSPIHKQDHLATSTESRAFSLTFAAIVLSSVACSVGFWAMRRRQSPPYPSKGRAAL